MGCSSSSNTHVDVALPRDSSHEGGNKTFYDVYHLGPKLGRGAFAQVRLAEMNVSDKCITRAVKIIDLRDKNNLNESNRTQEKAARSEVTVWKAVGNHPNVIRLYDTYHGDNLCYLVMERCSCSLLSALEKTPDFNESTLARVVVQMVQGLAHVHKARVVHRDVKPDNFLCGGDNGDTVKLGDFGLSTGMPKVGGVSGVFGTAPFMCPEMLAGRWYNDRADVWSVAVIAYVMLFGVFPYMPKEQSSKGMKQAISDGHPAPKYEHSGRHLGQIEVSKNAIEFCASLLNRDAEKRPSSAEVLTMPWMLQAVDDPHESPFPENMSSLRPMIYCAKKVGAFEVRDTSRDDRTDEWLDQLHRRYLRMPLPATVPQATATRRAPGNERRSSKGDSAKSDSSKSDFRDKKHKLDKRAAPPGSANNWDNASITTRSTTCESSSDKEDWSFKGSGWSKGTAPTFSPSSKSSGFS